MALATDLERLVVSLEANIKSYEREMRRARDQTDGAARAIEKRMQEVGTRIDRIMSTSAAAISTGFQRIGGLAERHGSQVGLRVGCPSANA